MEKSMMKKICLVILLASACLTIAPAAFCKGEEKRKSVFKQTDNAFLAVMNSVRKDTLHGKGNVYEAEAGDDLSEHLTHLKAGDTLLLKDGHYTEAIDISGLHGTKKNYITIAAAPGASPVFDGSGLSVISDDHELPDGPVMIHISDCSYVRLSGISIAHAEGQSSCGISIEPGCDHMIIDRCSMEDITVPDPKTKDHCANGILLFGDSADKTIEHIFIYKNTIMNCATGWAECISAAGHVANVTVEENTIDNTGNIGIDFTGNYGYCPDPSKDFPVNCEAVRNTVKNCRSQYATSYGLYADGAQGIEFRDNTIIACSGGIEIGAEEPQKKKAYATQNILVTGNEIYDCPDAGITIGGYNTDLGWVKNVEVSGNTCKNSGTDTEGAILILAKCQQILIENNIFEAGLKKKFFVRSEMKNKWTKNIVFKKNTYKGAASAKTALFEMFGKKYTGFSAWKDISGEKDAVYKKMKK